MSTLSYDRILDDKRAMAKKKSALTIYNTRKSLNLCVACGGAKETSAVRCNDCLQIVRHSLWRMTSRAKK